MDNLKPNKNVIHPKDLLKKEREIGNFETYLTKTQSENSFV